MTRSFSVRWIGFLGLSLAAALAAAAPPADRTGEVTDDEGGQVYVRGMWASLSELQSGEVEYKESTTFQGRKTESTVFYAFDMPTKRFRFDRRIGMRLLQSARNDECSLVYDTPDEDSKLPRMVIKYLPEKQIGMHDARPFDLQIVGLAHWHFFDQSWSLAELRQVYEPVLYSRPATRVTRAGDRVTLFWSGPADRETSDVTIVLDASMGYRPVRKESYTKRPGRADYVPEGWSEVEWVKVNDVFVPKRWHVEAPDVPAVTDIEFKWRQANGPVPDRYFTMDGLGLPKGTVILNMKTGQPIREGKVGDTVAAAGPPPQGFGSARRLRWVLAANAAAVLGIACVALGRRVRRR